MENLMKNGSCHVMAGNKRLLIADTNEVQRIELTDFATKTVTMKTGCGFAEISAKSIQVEVTEDGGAYSHGITCRLAGTKRKYDRLLADMAKGGWIAKIVDNTDTVWLSGSLESAPTTLPTPSRWASCLPPHCWWPRPPVRPCA